MPEQLLTRPLNGTEGATHARSLAALYHKAHNAMRNIDGLQPQEAFDELLRFMFYKECSEDASANAGFARRVLADGTFSKANNSTPGQIRKAFRSYLKESDSWIKQLWRDGEFHISDQTIQALSDIFQNIRLREVGFDLRSAALREFLSPEIRKGLGMYLSPDAVVKMMAAVVAPESDARVYDPACGSGTFLTETLNFWQSQENAPKKLQVWGSDKNPRMLMLAELNLGHLPNVKFEHRLHDAFASQKEDNWPQPNYFDVILTNPPFGVNLDGSAVDFSKFETCKDAADRLVAKIQSEVVFIEQSLRLLKPGGILGIILPRSVVTNTALAHARKVLGALGYVYAVVSLPPETFAVTGTQTNTVVLFFRKYLESEKPSQEIKVVRVNVDNVGYDSTGRHRDGAQLDLAATELRQALRTGKNTTLCQVLAPTPKADTLACIDDAIATRANPLHKRKTTRLVDLVAELRTGRTPARSAYSASGLFLVKVGNLTGCGIDWQPRDRNFVTKGIKSTLPILQIHDIVLTSSAHTPRYIAKKVDIITNLPDYMGGEASFVGEVMLVRAKSELIDPFRLVTYLRLPETVASIQRMVRGQTAHLRPDDMAELPIPDSLFGKSAVLDEATKILKQQAQLTDKLSNLRHDEICLQEQLEKLL